MHNARKISMICEMICVSPGSYACEAVTAATCYNQSMSIIAGQKIKIITGNETEARSETKVTPQMLQYLYVLQMNGPDFDSYIRNAVDENPMLEYKESAPDASADASDWPSDRSSDWQSDRLELHNGLSGEYSRDNTQTAGAGTRDRDREIDGDRDRDRDRDPLFNTAAAEPGFDRIHSTYWIHISSCGYC